MTTPSGSAKAGAAGQVAWEVLDGSTGQVVERGRRDIRPAQVEVTISAPAPFPRLEPDLRQVSAGLLAWLVTRGRARTLKRVRLGSGFWLVVPERPGPRQPYGLALQAQRDGEPTFCWEPFELSEGGATATKLQESGRLEVQWVRNRHGHQELTQLRFLTDVSLRLLPAAGPTAGDPAWRVRLLSGSVVPLPEAGNGLQLVPRLWSGRPPS